MKNDNIYYSYEKVLSYNALLNIIIGERGVGKSYGIKVYSVNHFLKKNKQFVYIRRYKTEIKKALGENHENKFFEQIKNVFPEHKLTNDNNNFYIDGKICGYAIPLSTANILKSSSFDNVDTIIFDEFIINKGSYHYLQDEVIQFLDIIETIGRLRDVKVFLIGNAISTTNPYFTFFDLTLPYNSDIKTFKNGLILVNYIKNEKYREVKKETRFGKLISDTKYGKYAIDNEFLTDNKYFIQKKNKNAKFFLILKINNKSYGVWKDYKDDIVFISNDVDPNCPIQFTLDNNDHNEKTILIRTRCNPFFKNIIEHYRIGRLCFESQNIKNNVMNYLLRYVTY